MTPLQILLIGMGALAIYSAIKDTNPVDVVKNALQGKDTPEPGSWNPGDVYTGGILDLGTNIYSEFVGPMRWPTSSRRTTAQFGDKGSLWESTHDGLDIDGECGDAVWSPVQGAVKYAGYNGAYGNTVKIRVFGHKSLEVWLCHLSGIAKRIRPGSTVSPGTNVGSMGQTGNAAGCHLHFMVVVDGNPVDPAPFLTGG